MGPDRPDKSYNGTDGESESRPIFRLRTIYGGNERQQGPNGPTYELIYRFRKCFKSDVCKGKTDVGLKRYTRK